MPRHFKQSPPRALALYPGSVKACNFMANSRLLHHCLKNAAQMCATIQLTFLHTMNETVLHVCGMTCVPRLTACQCLQKLPTEVYEMQWQVSRPEGRIHSATASSAKARTGHACQIHTPSGRFVARTGELRMRCRGAGSAAPRQVAPLVQTHSGCCAMLHALQQGLREGMLITADSLEGEGVFTFATIPG